MRSILPAFQCPIFGGMYCARECFYVEVARPTIISLLQIFVQNDRGSVGAATGWKEGIQHWFNNLGVVQASATAEQH